MKNLVEVCEEKKIKMIHFSTDYVYNSKEIIHLSEDSKTDPINYYGFSKREGEKIIEKSSSDSIIIRTSWLYSLYENNFVKNIIQKWGNENKIYVINDQFGCPTYAKDLVDCVLEMLKSENLFKKRFITFQMKVTQIGMTLQKIFELKINYPIVVVSSNKYKSIATRPKYQLQINQE